MTLPRETHVLALNAAEGLLQLLIARREAPADTASATVGGAASVTADAAASVTADAAASVKADVAASVTADATASVTADAAASVTADAAAAFIHRDAAPASAVHRAARSRGPIPPFVGQDGAVYAPLCFMSWQAPSQGAELLAPVLRDACARLHLAPSDLRRIAVVRGPGSFTGLRLALATAAGLVRATGAEQAGLAYLPLLAQGAALALAPVLPRGAGEAVFWAVTHARRQLVHMQGFSSSLVPLTDVLVCSPEEGAARIRASGGSMTGSMTGGRDSGMVFVLGSGLERNREAFAKVLSAGIACGETVLLPSRYSHPSEEALLRGAASAEYGREDVAPLYIRPSDAEENLEQIARNLGLNPEAARREAERLTCRAPEDE